MVSIIDISLPLNRDYRHVTPADVPDVQLEFERLKDYEGGAGQRVTGVRMRLHCGTHVDAPMHFKRGGAAISDLPIETFYGPATLLDLTGIDPGGSIEISDVKHALMGRPVQHARLLLRTDWNHQYGTSGYEAGSPYISPEAVDWIAARRPVLVSYDYSHGKDAPNSPEQYYAVRTFLTRDIATMGYVTNLDRIDPTRSAVLAALPLSFEGVEASPVRAVIIQED